MELRQLEYFVAVAEERNFTRAAERVRISQSGVSAQIRRLERELGAELFDRASRVVALTAAGKAALEPARAALAAAESVARAVDDVRGLIRGGLTVGMVTGCTITPLFAALADLSAGHPGVELSLLELPSDGLADGVRSGALDVALLGAAALPEGLEALTLIREPLTALVPPEHPLAGRTEATLAEVCAYPVVCMPPGTGLRTVFDLACAARDLTPHVSLTASAADAIADLSARGLGAAILTPSMSAAYADRLTVLPLSDASDPAYLALVWRPNPSPAVRAFLTHARARFALPGQDGVIRPDS
ncbi:LysR family transcriptional regulator [Actinocorallia sp. A-T 12471]|uniref:LysR family transcriptional regulator n=1 Tax=Actinocorallia sp. A-T 12471 TaxID=3089813 RepID=UPI0029D0DDBC|nr:LysR substrate-binding domain-containing protein [Actinocorallia sp. A-T 12471]MDX6741321.1 LysR substrate-binding domain-containing protein [Actinocorallia sp. A-T 12471]